MNSSSSLKKYYFILEGSKKYKIKEKEPFLARLPLLVILSYFASFFIKKRENFYIDYLEVFLFYSFLFLLPPFFSFIIIFSLDFYCGRDVWMRAFDFLLIFCYTITIADSYRWGDLSRNFDFKTLINRLTEG